MFTTETTSSSAINMPTISLAETKEPKHFDTIPVTAISVTFILLFFVILTGICVAILCVVRRKKAQERNERSPESELIHSFTHITELQCNITDIMVRDNEAYDTVGFQRHQHTRRKPDDNSTIELQSCKAYEFIKTIKEN